LSRERRFWTRLAVVRLASLSSCWPAQDQFRHGLDVSNPNVAMTMMLFTRPPVIAVVD
jgi:hypothetical protein